MLLLTLGLLGGLTCVLAHAQPPRADVPLL
jgi:hypothetical protein